MKRIKNPSFGTGTILHAQVTEQYNNKEVISEGRAKANDPVQVKALLEYLRARGVSIPKEKE